MRHISPYGKVVSVVHSSSHVCTRHPGHVGYLEFEKNKLYMSDWICYVVVAMEVHTFLPFNDKY